MSSILIFNKSNLELLTIYKNLAQDISNSTHYLASNYYENNLDIDNQEIFTIALKNKNPFLFSSIYRRDYWPSGCYRILNRLGKIHIDSTPNKTIDECFLAMIQKQIEWLAENKIDFKTAIISRNNNSKLMFHNLSIELMKINLPFHLYENKIWVCKGDKKSCFQNILYYGNKNLLDTWTI